jgi:hypothetical protein
MQWQNERSVTVAHAGGPNPGYWNRDWHSSHKFIGPGIKLELGLPAGPRIRRPGSPGLS